MSRKAWIDAAGALHHIIMGGTEHGKSFGTDADRDSFVKRLGQALKESHGDSFQWVLLFKHAFYCEVTK